MSVREANAIEGLLKLRATTLAAAHQQCEKVASTINTPGVGLGAGGAAWMVYVQQRMCAAAMLWHPIPSRAIRQTVKGLAAATRQWRGVNIQVEPVMRIMITDAYVPGATHPPGYVSFSVPAESFVQGVAALPSLPPIARTFLEPPLPTGNAEIDREMIVDHAMRSAVVARAFYNACACADQAGLSRPAGLTLRGPWAGPGVVVCGGGWTDCPNCEGGNSALFMGTTFYNTGTELLWAIGTLLVDAPAGGF